MSAQSIHNLVRGLTAPYEGAHFLVDGKEIKVWKTAVFLDASNNSIYIKTTAGGNPDLILKIEHIFQSSDQLIEKAKEFLTNNEVSDVEVNGITGPGPYIYRKK